MLSTTSSGRDKTGVVSFTVAVSRSLSAASASRGCIKSLDLRRALAAYNNFVAASLISLEFALSRFVTVLLIRL